MPEIKFPSEWLKIGENVQDGDQIVFRDVGVLDEDGEKYTFKVEIFHGAIATETKSFTLNKTNFKAIAAIYGTNSDEWLGKSMTVNKITVRNPQTGLLVASIGLTAPIISTNLPAGAPITTGGFVAPPIQPPAA